MCSEALRAHGAAFLGVALALMAAPPPPAGAVQTAARAAPTAAPGPATAGGGQDARIPDREAELVRVIDSLVPLYRAADERVDGANRRRREAERAARRGLDTLELGPVKVVVWEEEAGRARDVVGGVLDADFRPWFTRTPMADTLLLTFRWSGRERVPVDAGYALRVEAERYRLRGYLEEGVRNAVGELLARELRGTPLGPWIGGATRVRPPDRPADLYREAATAPSAAVRACLGGDAAACVDALALGGRDTPLERWYTPGERRLLARRMGGLVAEGSVTQCRAGIQEGCDAALEEFRALQNPAVPGAQPYWGAPLSAAVRTSFLWFALRRGGDGAWERLLATSEQGVGPALAAAAGMDLPDLAAEWRTWLLEQRPRRPETSAASSLPSLFWTLFFLAFALRSTRWRFA